MLSCRAPKFADSPLPTPLSPIITCHFSTAFQFVCTNMATFCKHVDAIEVHTPPSIREKYQNNYSTDIYSPTDNILNFNIGKMAKIWANPVCRIDTDKSRFWGSYWKLFMAVYVLSKYCFCSVWVETKSGKFFSKLLSRRGNWLKSFQAGRWKTVSTSRKAFPTDVLKTLQDCKTALTSQFWSLYLVLIMVMVSGSRSRSFQKCPDFKNGRQILVCTNLDSR